MVHWWAEEKIRASVSRRRDQLCKALPESDFKFKRTYIKATIAVSDWRSRTNNSNTRKSQHSQTQITFRFAKYAPIIPRDSEYNFHGWLIRLFFLSSPRFSGAVSFAVCCRGLYLVTFICTKSKTRASPGVLVRSTASVLILYQSNHHYTANTKWSSSSDGFIIGAASAVFRAPIDVGELITGSWGGEKEKVREKLSSSVLLYNFIVIVIASGEPI